MMYMAVYIVCVLHCMCTACYIALHASHMYCMTLKWRCLPHFQSLSMLRIAAALSESWVKYLKACL